MAEKERLGFSGGGWHQVLMDEGVVHPTFGWGVAMLASQRLPVWGYVGQWASEGRGRGGVRG